MEPKEHQFTHEVKYIHSVVDMLSGDVMDKSEHSAAVVGLGTWPRLQS